MYFPMKAAVSRLGGIASAAQRLGVTTAAVSAWITTTRRSRPPQPLLERLAEESGVSLDSLELYYRNLEVYRENESFRRIKHDN